MEKRRISDGEGKGGGRGEKEGEGGKVDVIKTIDLRQLSEMLVRSHEFTQI